jgi:hypothetical protein
LILQGSTDFCLFCEFFLYFNSIIFTINNKVYCMTTKPPSSVADSPAGSLEKIAYAAVADIPTEEVNDRNRLGYCLWGWLSERQGTLLQTVRSAGVRSTLTPEAIVAQIQKRLEDQGMKIS